MSRLSILVLYLAFLKMHIQSFKGRRLPRFGEIFSYKSPVQSHKSSVIDLTTALVSKENITQTLLNLIAYGDTHYSDTDVLLNHSHNDPFDDWVKVSGCLANVNIKVTAALLNDNMLYQIIGTADSRIARGLLTILCEGLSGSTAIDILNLNAENLAIDCNLQNILPPGRMNGFKNMLLTIQSEVKRLQHVYKVENHENDVNRLPTKHHPDEVAMLLSGGVDSSVALKLLLLQGYKVRAFYLKIWLEDEISHLNECPWEEDMRYASEVCNKLNVPLETISLQKEYWNEVIKYTLSEAVLGRTPNPDIMCNSRIKFGMFYNYIGQYYHKVATGHYAQVRMKPPSKPIPTSSYSQAEVIYNITESSSVATTIVHDTTRSANEHCKNESDMEAELHCSVDPIKDQTYFLCNLRQDQLKRALFPIGHLNKSQVRELAQKYNLPTQNRKDSQGICFLGKLKFDDFIQHYLGEKPGDIRDSMTGSNVGRHRGLWFHTIGQRKGLGPVMNVGTLHLGPWYVTSKDVARNTLYVTNNLQFVEAPCHEFTVSKLNWIRGTPPEQLLRMTSVTSETYDTLANSPISIDSGCDTIRGASPLLSAPFSAETNVALAKSSVLIDSGIGMQVMVKLRHGPSFSQAHLLIDKVGTNLGNIEKDVVQGLPLVVRVLLDKKEKGIAPGQFAAFYQDGVCLGAGIIQDSGHFEETASDLLFEFQSDKE